MNFLKQKFIPAKACKALVDFSGNSSHVFLTALFAGIIMSLLAFLFIYDMYRDVAGVYAYYAREISSGNWADAWVGRVPMLHILLSGCLAKFSGLNAFRACVAISSLFFVLTLFPLRSFLERYVSPIWSAWGCVLFIFAPKVIRFSVSGLLDSGRYFFLMTSLLYFFRLSDKQIKMRDALILGISLAGLSVSRGEGLILAAMLLAGYPFFTLLKQKRIALLKKHFASWGLCALFFIIGLLPFCYGNWKNYNCFVPDMRLNELVRYFMGSKLNNDLQSAQSEMHQDISSLIFEQTSQYGDIVDALKDTLRGGYEPYLFLALIGMIILSLKKRWNWELAILPGICLLHVIIYGNVVSAYRYSIYLVPMFMPFTVMGLSFIGTKISFILNCKYPQKSSVITLTGALLIVLLLIYQVENGMWCVVKRQNKKYHEAAAFIRNYVEKNFPDRRARIAAKDCAVVVYHSGAISWWGYKQQEILGHDMRNFDLLLLKKNKNMDLLKLFDDLHEIPTPETLQIRLFRKKRSAQ